MSEAEIRRRRTNDPEMDAMAVIADAMRPLDLDTRKRVLDWAKDRILEGEKRAIGLEVQTGILAHVEQVQAKAKEMGVTDLQLIHAFSALRHRRGLAPIDDGEVTDEELREALPAEP